jgi:hypothetical protein
MVMGKNSSRRKRRRGGEEEEEEGGKVRLIYPSIHASRYALHVWENNSRRRQVSDMCVVNTHLEAHVVRRA